MFAASANHPARFHQERRQRRGSLPLKKRRVCLDLDKAGSANPASPFFTYKPASTSIKQQQLPQVQQQQASDFNTASGHQQYHKLALLPTQSLFSPATTTTTTNPVSGQQVGQLKFPGSSSSSLSSSSANDTTKLAALSLIAAAAAQQVPTFPKQQQQLPLLASRLAPVTEEPYSGGGAQDVDDESLDGASSSSSDTDSSDDEEEQELILSNTKPASDTAITTIASGGNTNLEQKIRTSLSSCRYKNCKRTAGFRGSDYCKLHVLQVKKDKDNTKTKIFTSKKSLSSNSKQSTKTTITTTTTTTTPTVTNTSGQDKRYTGVEVRCCATTTRGRACAYIAVGTTKYCHMHADYDTNPPPRRGLKSPTPSSTSAAAVAAAASPIPKKASTSSTSGSSSSSTLKSRGNSDKASPAPPAAVARRSSAKRAEKHADSPYPLLSMLSTDQWFQRKVQVAVGPLRGRVGSVQKWGNGWISVQIPGVAGLHNRRSFELYLQDVDGNNNNSVGETTKKSQERAQGASSSKKRKAKAAPAAAADPEAESIGLFRCVSRDVDVVSPSPSTDHSIRSARSFTPKLTASGSSSGSARAGKFSPAPETPTPLLAAGRPSSFLTPVPQKAAAAPPKVTPLLNEDAKPIVSLKSSCDRLQLPDTTGESESKAMVFRPTAAAAAPNTN